MRRILGGFTGRCPMPRCFGRATWHVNQTAQTGISWEVCQRCAGQLLREGGTAHRIRPERERRRLLHI